MGRAQKSGFARLIRFAAAATTVAAIAQELSKPKAERTWHGKVADLIPYDFRIPTVDRLRARVWAPEDSRLLRPQVFGVGWTVNVGRIVRLILDAVAAPDQQA